MPCLLTKGFTLDCKDIGGVLEIKVKAFSPADIADITPQTDGSVTITVSAQTGWFKYELNKEQGTLEEKSPISVENRSVAYEQTIKFALYNLSKDKQVELDLLAKNRLWVAVKTTNGTAWLVGYDLGADVTELAKSTGKALTDRNGQDITIIGRSKTPMLDCTTNYGSLA